MGLTRADLTFTNMLSQARIEIRALVDTGTMHMCVTAAQARQLGFDPEDCTTVMVTLADGRRIEVPRIRPIEIAFANRTFATEAFVLGDEALIGVVPIEAMDLVIDPRSRRLSVNPRHPDYPVFYAKYARNQRWSEARVRVSERQIGPSVTGVRPSALSQPLKPHYQGRWT